MSFDGTDQFPGPGDQPQVPGPGPAQADQSTMTASPRQLVRDPYTRLGGVASGLAHYFGIDVSIVRLGFVLSTFFSGVGLIVYLLAWLVVPRAEYWPPVSTTARPMRSITGREVGIGIVALGALLFLFFNGGGTARVLVPLLLVAGGAWLLRQPESASPPAPAQPQAIPPSYPTPGERTQVFESTETTAVAEPFSSENAPQPPDTLTAPPIVPPVVPPAAGGPAPGTPVPPRRRRWRRVVFALLFIFVLLPVVLIALVAGLVLGSGFDFDGGFDSVYRPQSVEEIPSNIDQDAGEVLLDLTEIDVDDYRPSPPDVANPPNLSAPPGLSGPTQLAPPDFSAPDLPIPIKIDLGVGEIRVIVPDELAIEVDAEAGVGDVAVFGQSESGIRNSVPIEADDPVIDLEIRLGAGDIDVRRGS